MNELGTLLVALLRYNVAMTVIAVSIALPVACLFAAAKLSPNPALRFAATAYVNALRSSPLVMIMFWVYTVGPIVTGSPNSAYHAALLALAAFEVAYFTEIIRSGVQSIRAGQAQAALATGLTRAQAMRLVVLPQAIRLMIPSLLTQSVIAFQDSTIASVISVPDILQTTTVINAREQNPILLYSMLAATFFLVCAGLGAIVRRLDRESPLRMSHPAV